MQKLFDDFQVTTHRSSFEESSVLPKFFLSNDWLVCDIGTSKIFKFEFSKSFVMIFFAWSKVGRITPESRNLF